MSRSMMCSAILGITFAVASPLSAEAKGKVLGHGVKLRVATPIGALQGSPARWLGKTVRADGVVTAVCEKAGCWLDLSDEQTGKRIRFKVDDGVIVFPLTARGHKASAEGVFEQVIVPPDEHKKHERESGAHAGHEGHEGHDAPAKGPTYRIRATGAIIH